MNAYTSAKHSLKLDNRKVTARKFYKSPNICSFLRSTLYKKEIYDKDVQFMVYAGDLRKVKPQIVQQCFLQTISEISADIFFDRILETVLR